MTPWEWMVELYGRTSWYPLAGCLAFALAAPAVRQRYGLRRLAALAAAAVVGTGLVATVGLVLAGAPVRAAPFEALALALVVLLVCFVELPLLWLLGRTRLRAGYQAALLGVATVFLVPAAAVVVVMGACLAAGTCN